MLVQSSGTSARLGGVIFASAGLLHDFHAGRVPLGAGLNAFRSYLRIPDQAFIFTPGEMFLP